MASKKTPVDKKNLVIPDFIFDHLHPDEGGGDEMSLKQAAQGVFDIMALVAISAIGIFVFFYFCMFFLSIIGIPSLLLLEVIFDAEILDYSRIDDFFYSSHRGGFTGAAIVAIIVAIRFVWLKIDDRIAFVKK